jgi:LPS export ABC transporter protein LptC
LEFSHDDIQLKKKIIKYKKTKSLNGIFGKKIFQKNFRVFCCTLFLLAVIGCGEEKLKPNIDKSLNEAALPDQESWKSQISFSDEGKIKAILMTDHLVKYDKRHETLLEKVHIDFFNDQQKKTTTLTSLRGRVDDITKNMYAIDSVVAVSDSGVVLKTDELMWRNSDKKIVSDKYVTIISPTEKICGYGFESDQHLRNYTIKKITIVTSSTGLELSK